ncbi:hypothetical protein SERLADRAFT_414850 [Serpula lacrymans var. lacrymans S7.9]|uniref:Mediator of RNA polymerase II transcription subunit 14 n=1 Tax=Serpula lacrymans var. lacrymans (strain S7.9) TaxID=578457 RepID=F8NU13_SERL9|nr:uncharacterized protein SERLADRAFT_414850 [Serpula lacrymans var. lacrymans S7.9]EGO25140.1 hypothetical protein SERLADRAFT_414850 [Serpula lacrymans var. lacrymans S7.9]
MDHARNGANGVVELDTRIQNPPSPLANGFHVNGVHEHTPEELERELPVVYDGQVALGEVLSRVVQAIYAELSELAETLPNMSDTARKRTLADWVVKTKKQVVKLYAITKWARDAQTVQKCMNITAFLMNQNQQFEDVMRGLTYAKESLDPARLRNHDLLTSLDVLTTGSYRRLPSVIKKLIVPPTPLMDAEVAKTLTDMEDAIRLRLRMHEIIPVEMSQHRIADGRAHFTVPKLFEVSLCLRGAERNDGWFFVGVKFLITVGGDLTGMQEFPQMPTGMLKRHIADEADARLAYYIPLPQEEEPVPGVEVPPRPQLPEGTADAPLVRVFNFLRKIIFVHCFMRGAADYVQAQRMRSLGWADYLKVEMSNGRKTLTVSYWVRQLPPSIPGRPQPPNRSKLPLTGGTLTISIVESRAPPQVGGGPIRSPIARVLAELQQKSKLGNLRPSDEAEGLKFQVVWEPIKGAFGVVIAAVDAVMANDLLVVNPYNLDFESLLRKVIKQHTKAILNVFQTQLQRGPTRTVFSPPGEVVLTEEGGSYALRIHLCADEVVVISIDTRTGRLNLRDTGDLAAAGRGPRFTAISERLNQDPSLLLDALVRLRLNTITDLAEQKANYLGLHSYRQRNFSREELHKLGPSARGMLYIQLSNFPNHYLVLVITDEEFRYALISVRVLTDTMYANLIMEDIAWLDVQRIRGDNNAIFDITGGLSAPMDGSELQMGHKRKRNAEDDIVKEEKGKERREGSFNLETQVLRELYAYCCARVAYTKVEQQFKIRGIPYSHVNPTSGYPLPSELSQIQSSLARSVPALCVQSSDILSGAPAAEAAMPNIRVIPLNWWSNKKVQVVTCVKLKYVQQPVGRRANGGSSIIRPSKRIIYDTTEAVVSFLSEEVDMCVDEFLEEWARVSKMVVIAREVAQMAEDGKWPDVRLLSFDLQTVEFAYAHDYTVSIRCMDQLSPTGGSFDLRFSRCPPSDPQARATSPPPFQDRKNPHEDVEPFLQQILRHGPLTSSLHRLVELLRDTLPIVVEIERMRLEPGSSSSMSPNRGRGKGKGKAVVGWENEPWVETFVKGLGWYRVLYGDLRHALDFRLMNNQRVAIIDGSHSLFGSDVSGSASVSSTSSPDLLGLQAIPDLPSLIQAAVHSVRSASGGLSLGKIAPIDVGIVCNTGAVGAVARALHERILKKLQGEYS